MRICIIGCCKQKRGKAGRAEEVYCSQHFKAAITWARRFCDRVFIASSKLGLIEASKIIAPYNHTFSTNARAKAPSKVEASEVAAWGKRVASSIRSVTSDGDVIVFILGRRYRDAIVSGIPDFKVEVIHGDCKLATRTERLKNEVRKSA